MEWSVTSCSFVHLDDEHGARRDLHVVAQLEVLQEHDRLGHADVAVCLERHVGERPPRVQVPDDQLGHNVQPRLLLKKSVTQVTKGSTDSSDVKVKL
jgi:hypothetical protein